MKTVQKIDWPTNLVWRIVMSRFKNVPSISPIRENKMFAMPFRNWEGTYLKLMGKDFSKIKYMKTQVLEITGDMLVADMSEFDLALSQGAEYGRDGRASLQKYEDTAIPYSQFIKNPMVFDNPEILIDRNSIQFLPYKIGIYAPHHTNPELGVISI